MVVASLRMAVLLLAFTFGALSHAHANSATTILLFGDSIVAGYGLSAEQSLPVRVEEKLAQMGITTTVINGGISGDTTAGGLSRLEWTITKHQPDIVLIALGGNDVLRGIAPDISKNNLNQMLSLLDNQDITTILSKVQAPANLGLKYMLNFNSLFDELADDYDVPLYPFLLEKTFGNPALMQSDGIHPNASGIEMIADDLASYLAALPALEK